MKLRTGKPVWLRAGAPQVRLADTPRGGTQDKTCDVVVIGAGITGALVAYRLLKAGLTVVVCDKRASGFGSTAASTGLLLYEPDMAMAQIARRHGIAAARRAYQLGWRAIGELERLVRALGLECGWRKRESLYVASHRRDVAALRREGSDRRRARLPVKFLDEAEVKARFGLAFPAALLATGAAEVDALRLTRGLLARCERDPRFTLRQHVRVRGVDEDARGVTVRTTAGAWHARYAIVATGYETRGFVSSRLVQLHSTYVIASAPQPAARLRHLSCLMWETARPYFYLRTTIDRRIVFGGLDDRFFNASQGARRVAAKTRGLEALFARLFPTLAFTAQYAWTGAFADTTDGLPCIGPTKRGSRVLFALGYGGNGITFSQIAAKIITDHCTGRRHRDAGLFAFTRRGRIHRGRR